MIHFDSHVASHGSHMISHDLQMASHMRSDSRPKHNTFMPPEASFSPHSNEPWHGFSNEGMISFYPPSRYRKAASREENDTESFPMRRHDSQGAFTDDFVTSPKQPSNQYLPLDTTQTRPRFSENRVAALARSSYTSENDLSPCQDIQYRRLSPSPNGGSSVSTFTSGFWVTRSVPFNSRSNLCLVEVSSVWLVWSGSFPDFLFCSSCEGLSQVFSLQMETKCHL